MIEWANVVAGLGVGIVVGITGVGGGALMTPILILLFGVAPASAIGTDLWFAAITKMAGGFVHHRQGTVDKEVLTRLAAGSLPAALLTLAWLRWGGGSKVQSGVLMSALGVMLLVTAVMMLFKSRLHAWGRTQRIGVPVDFKRWQAPLTTIGGAVLGVMVTLTSIGAGALGAVMLLALYPLRMTPARLVGTDIVHAVPLALVAGTGHLLLGNVDGGLLFQLLLGSIPGIIVGSLASPRMPEPALRIALSLMLVVAAIKLIG